MKKSLLFTAIISTLIIMQVDAYPPPERREMTLVELESKIYDLDGKAVEIEISSVHNFEQTGAGKYEAYCNYWDGRTWGGRRIYFSGEEAKEFLEDMVKKGTWGRGSTESLYVLVDGKKLRALGTRYRKSKNEYSW